MRSLESLHRADEACLRFEDDLRAGRRPGVAAYLDDVPPDEREPLLAELLLLEWDYRFRADDSFYLEEYCRRYPAQRAAVERAWARWKQHEHHAWDTVGPNDTRDGQPSTTDSPAVLGLPGFEQVTLLSRGGMGEVYRAFDPGLRRWVALKQVRLEQVAPDKLARFRVEAEALARLAHPHIVKVHGYTEAEGQPVLEMEYVAHGTLEERLGRQPVSPQEAARLIAVVAWAVHAAHEKGIVHRDLKPANVLMDEPVPGDPTNALG